MVMADQCPIYAPAAGVIYAKTSSVWLEAETGVHSITNVMPLVVTGQRVLAGTYIAAATSSTLHWDYHARRDCTHCMRHLAEADVRSMPGDDGIVAGPWQLCHRCFGKLLSSWRLRWLAMGSPFNWAIDVRAHLSRRPIAVLRFRGEGGLRVV